MATYSMLRELAARRQWVEEVNEAMRRLSPHTQERAVWPDLRRYYEEGYNAEQTAAKYLEATHQGENS
jgi:hypothetical protein